MKLLHCADLHLGCYPDGNEARFWDFCAGFARACDEAISRGAEAMVIAGDLFHQRTIDPRTLGAAVAQLERLRAAGVACVAIEGNHDKAFYAMRQSWMEYLDAAGLLTLLKPMFDEQARPHLPAYAEGRGSVLVRGGVRFVGFGYLGASTRARLKLLEEELPAFAGFTVGLLHSGVDNLRGLDMGAVASADLEPFRGRVDYFALGHVHTRWENGWAYNPGAPENVHLGESRRGEKGYYLLEITGAHTYTLEYLPAQGRPARYCTLDASGLAMEALPAAAAAACAGTQPGELLSLRLTGETPGLPDAEALRAALLSAYAPLVVELRDETRDAGGVAHQAQGADVQALEREVMARLAREHGLPEAAGGAALALCDALLARQGPEALYAMLEGYLGEWEEDAACES